MRGWVDGAARGPLAGGPGGVRGRTRRGRVAGGARGPELGGVVARRRGRVFAARERAYRLYRRRGTPPRRPRHGDLARRRRARLPRRRGRRARLAAAGPPAARPARARAGHGWLAFHEGYVAHAGGDTATARELAARAAELGRRFDVADLEMLGLALEGSALVACARVEEGMRCLDEATAAALEGEAEIPISGAWACCFLVTACTAVLDLERAGDWCDRIAEFADRYGSRYMLAFCRAEYGAVHLWRGRGRGGGAARGGRRGLLGLAARVGRRRRWSGWPSSGGGRGGRTRRRALLERAGRDGVRSSAARAGARPRRGRAGRRSSPSGSCAQVPADRALDRAPALELLVARADRARRARRGGAGARGAARGRAVRRHARRSAPAPTWSTGVSRPPRADHERARTLLEDAVDGFERSGAPVRGGAGADRARDAAWSRSGAPAAGARSSRRASACVALGAAAEAARASGCSAPTADGGELARQPESRRASARCCACSPRGSRTGRSPSGSS